MNDEQRQPDSLTLRQSSWTGRIFSAILWTPIVLLAVLVWKSGNHAAALRTELTELRAKGGHLEIHHPDKFYAIRIPTSDPYEWAWRVYVPSGAKLMQRCYTGRMPAVGLPGDATWRAARGADYGGGSTGPIGTGQFVLRIYLKERENGNWEVRIQKSAGWSAYGHKPHSGWLHERDWVETSDAPAGKQNELSTSEDIVFLRLRNESSVKADDPNRVADTIVIWFDDGSIAAR
jgi:hypothetical protein